MRHITDGPDVPHIGYQTEGKQNQSGGAVRGHKFVDDVPVNRSR
ncbi:polymorphic toxin type 47 domain-containing protein [Paenibacillus sp. HB172176]|nr:polymorphic toxin type 47 domain-containing protein [Paenibacillus sp. HB172176]